MPIRLYHEMDAEEIVYVVEERHSEFEEEESATESIGSPHGSGSSATTVLDSEEEEEGDTRGGRNTADPLVQDPQGHGRERVSDPQAPFVEEDEDANSEDFQEPAAKRKKRDSLTVRGSAAQDEHSKLNTSTDDGQTCSICLEPWTNSGVHRLSSLKCGHLFGFTCIDKWLHGQGNKCPQCNSKAKRADIRMIYAKTITVVDTTERDRALQELEREKAARIMAQKSEAQAIIQFQLTRAECERLQQRVADLEARQKLLPHSSSSSEQPGPSLLERGAAALGGAESGGGDGHYVGMKSLPITTQGEARVTAFDSSAAMLVVSKPSSNQLLPGFGLLKVSGLELRSSEFVSIHQGVLRDVVFGPEGDGLVLSASMDKTLKLTSMVSNTVVQSYNLPGPAWSCVWDSDDPFLLYAGLQNGMIMSFDMRNTAEHLHTLKLERPCPVTSLAFAPRNRSIGFLHGGVLAGTLEGLVLCEKTREEGLTVSSFVPGLSPDGACTCVSFEPLTQHCLASFRPGKRHPQSRHLVSHNGATYQDIAEEQVGQLVSAADTAHALHPLHQFKGSTANKLLSKSALFAKPGQDSQLLAAFGDEAKRTVQVWQCSTGQQMQDLSGDGEPVIDITPFTVNSSDYLALLTAHKLLVYKWECPSIT